uniref:SAM domain containing protein n=1 Tax=Echinococcus granulosus TaxID=6210 RepID=A0A068WWW6_ECHGR|nr:SAM domain containing protein [Echinococcus granulosus]
MEKSKPTLGKLIQKKIKGRGIFSKNDKSPQEAVENLFGEKTDRAEEQAMECFDQSNANNDKNNNPYTASPRYSKPGALKPAAVDGQEYWHPVFAGTPSERSTSAPVSPVSGYDSPTPLLDLSRLPSNISGHRQPPPVTIYRANRSRGLRWKPPDVYKRVLSPHQSEMSLSAPSSPGNGSSCYEQIPMECFKGTEDDDPDYDRPYRRPWASNFDEASRRHRRWRLSHHNSGHYPHYHQHQHHHRTHHKCPGETQDLLVLLKKLGLESLYQRLLQHGLARIDQLGGLTRQRLIDMGVTSAEARASLLTAAQLLTNSRIETPVCIISEGEDASATWNRTPINYEPKSLYARGDILLPRSSDYWLRQGVPETQGQEIDHRISQSTGGATNDSASHETHFGVRKHFPGIPRNDSLAAQRSNSLGPKLPNDLKMAMPPRILEMTGSNVGSLNKNYAPGEISFARPKTPVGILRKSSMRNQQSGEANRSCLPECGRKRTASTPKSVKIDESSLQHQNSTTNSANLESLIAERLRVEWIDLTKPPYTNAAGESGIPLRLVERYAEEVDKDFMTIAMILETLRERSLTGAGLHFTPNYDDIRTQRYLNCSGIKTDNLTDFLTTIGLPMYSNRLVAALGSAELALPACLTAVTDAQMVYGLDIPLTHVRRIRTEAALIPKSLLAANTSSMPRSNGLTKQMIFRRQQHHHHHQQQQSQQQQLQFRQVFSKSDILPPESGILDRV